MKMLVKIICPIEPFNSMVKDGSEDIPSIAEPWFLNFEAVCEFRIAMTSDDLTKADLENPGKSGAKYETFIKTA